MSKVKQKWNNYNKYAESIENRRIAKELSAEFIRNEQQFHLGFLPTEQSHPYTRNFSDTIKRNRIQGVRQLLKVDFDLPPAARRVLLTPAFDRLVAAVARVIETKNHICFSGCGSTGRLAILLESIWREYWGNRERQDLADLGCCIMTGGDRALIRAVESFEDYEVFGRRQVQDLAIASGDLFITISEGGETSSVIGTAKEAADRGAEVFFLFNNPAVILGDQINRSKELLHDSRITVLDLYSGPMALSGSTRLQATTLELFVIGAALEEAFEAQPERRKNPHGARLNRVNSFAHLIDQLSDEHNSASMARFVDIETNAYKSGGLVTYYARTYLLDIFSDTTERSPTFMLPPYARYKEEVPPAWAHAKDPDRSSLDAWMHILKRKPRGVDWTHKDYLDMAPESPYVENVPALGFDEIVKYAIGNEEDISRFPNDTSHLFLVTRAEDDGKLKVPKELGVTHIIIDSEDSLQKDRDPSEETLLFSLLSEKSAIDLWGHIAVKLIFNTVSTAAMGLLGRIEGNWMIQVDPTNKKLIDRGSRLIAELTGISYEAACYELFLSLGARKKAESAGEDTILSPVAAALERLGKREV